MDNRNLLTSNRDLEAFIFNHLKHIFCKQLEIIAINELPTNVCQISYPAIFIINSEPNFRNGEDWVVVFLENKNKGEFFDPLGFPPSQYGCEIVRFLKKQCAKKYYIMKQPVQNQSSTACGYYVCYYVMKRLEGRNSYEILNNLSHYDERELVDIVRNW